MTLATLLTLARLASVPVIAYLLLAREPLACIAALGVFGLAALTDAYDGHLARIRNEITPLGTFLDPLVDKVLVLTLLGVFAALGFIAWWMYGIIAIREISVTAARIWAYRRGWDMSAKSLGKHKAAWQMVVLLVLMTILTIRTVGDSLEGGWRVLADERAMRWLSGLATGLMWVVLVLAVVSGGQFFLRMKRQSMK